MDTLCLDFLNSEWHNYRGAGEVVDYLVQPEWLAELLARWNLEMPGPLDADALASLVVLRRLLRRAVEVVAGGGQLSGDMLENINAALAAPVVRHVARAGTGYRVALAPQQRDWRAIRAAIAASFAELLAHHDQRRIKQCQNPNCRWVFYDESRNRSRRWCEGASCGNLLKVRRFRARRSATG